MRWLEIGSSRPVNGKVKVPGSKNSALGAIAACCLTKETVTLENVPNIRDIQVACEIGEEIGMKITRNGNTLKVDPSGISGSVINPLKSNKFRTAYYFIGSLLANHKKVTIGYPGGDNFGPRPIDQHIKGLKALGARFTFYKDYYVVEADKLVGTNIYFDTVTCGATINLMLAAVLADGMTVLHHAARDPEVVDIAILLNSLGARVYGAGTDTIRIIGVEKLGSCTHTIIPDRLIAGAFLIAAGITEGQVTVEDVIPEHLECLLEKLAEVGLDIEKTDNTVTARYTGQIKATRIRTGMYPMFGSDYQQPFTALMLKAAGTSTIADRVYPRRFDHCKQLARMGAQISVRNGVARIRGNCPLKGEWVHASDIRAGICLILAGAMAEGRTCVTGLEHIERGYEDIVSSFRSLGVDITLCSDQREADVAGQL